MSLAIGTRTHACFWIEDTVAGVSGNLPTAVRHHFGRLGQTSRRQQLNRVHGLCTGRDTAFLEGRWDTVLGASKNAAVLDGLSSLTSQAVEVAFPESSELDERRQSGASASSSHASSSSRFSRNGHVINGMLKEASLSPSAASDVVDVLNDTVSLSFQNFSNTSSGSDRSCTTQPRNSSSNGYGMESTALDVEDTRAPIPSFNGTGMAVSDAGLQQSTSIVDAAGVGLCGAQASAGAEAKLESRQWHPGADLSPSGPAGVGITTDAAVGEGTGLIPSPPSVGVTGMPDRASPSTPPARPPGRRPVPPRIRHPSSSSAFLDGLLAQLDSVLSPQQNFRTSQTRAVTTAAGQSGRARALADSPGSSGHQSASRSLADSSSRRPALQPARGGTSPPPSALREGRQPGIWETATQRHAGATVGNAISGFAGDVGGPVAELSGSSAVANNTAIKQASSSRSAGGDGADALSAATQASRQPVPTSLPEQPRLQPDSQPPFSTPALPAAAGAAPKRSFMSAISHAECWQDVDRLLRRHAVNISGAHVAAMMTRLAALPMPPPPAARPPPVEASSDIGRTAERIAECIAERIREQHSASIAGVVGTTLPADVKAGDSGGCVLEDVLDEVASSLASSASGGVVSSEALRSGRQEGLSEQARWQALWRRLRERALFMAPKFEARQVVDMVHALANVGIQDTPLVAALLHFSQPFLVGQSMPARAFTKLAVDLARLNHAPPPQWLDQFFRGSGPLLPQLTAPLLVDLAYALARLRASPPRPWLALLYRCLRPLLLQLSPRELGNLAFAAARLAPPLRLAGESGGSSVAAVALPSSLWLGAFLEACEMSLDVFDAPAYALVMHSLGCLRYRPSRAWVSEYLESCAAVLHDFTPSEYSLLLCGLAFLGICPDGRWLRMFYHHSVARLADFNLAQLVNIGWALALLGLRAPPAWAAAYASRLHRLTGGDGSATLASVPPSPLQSIPTAEQDSEPSSQLISSLTTLTGAAHEGVPGPTGDAAASQPALSSSSLYASHPKPLFRASPRVAERAMGALAAAGCPPRGMIEWRHHLGLLAPGEPSREQLLARERYEQRRQRREARGDGGRANLQSVALRPAAPMRVRVLRWAAAAPEVDRSSFTPSSESQVAPGPEEVPSRESDRTPDFSSRSLSNASPSLFWEDTAGLTGSTSFPRTSPSGVSLGLSGDGRAGSDAVLRGEDGKHGDYMDAADHGHVVPEPAQVLRESPSVIAGQVRTDVVAG